MSRYTASLVRLPNQKTAPAKSQPFATGSKVVLAAAPNDPPGTVRRVERGFVYVKWGDLGYVGKHRAVALALVGCDQECPEDEQT